MKLPSHASDATAASQPRPITDDSKLVLVVATATGVLEQTLAWPEASVIGRGPPPEGVSIDDPSVSRMHARFSRGPHGPLLQDLGSTNGTFVNNRRVTAEGEPVALGDALRFGSISAQIALRGSGVRQAGLVLAEDFDDIASEETERCIRMGLPTTLVVLDLQMAGGSTLAAVRKHMLAHLQAGDAITIRAPGRVDVLLCGCSKNAALATAGRIVQALQNGQIKVRLGIAAVPEDAGSTKALAAAANDAMQRVRSGIGVGPEPSVVRRLGTREIVVADVAMMQVYRSVERVAGLPLPVLLWGETGTGKEIVGEAIHCLGPRAAMPLIKINCAAVPENLLESELFGYERGAFSGAATSKPGLIERAHGGTLFLDEIGEMPLALQAKILRVVEDMKVHRLGAMVDRPVDVRIVAASHRELLVLAEQGRFRQDLYYRLSTLQIRIPPLRERKQEIPLLAQRFAELTANAAGRQVLPFTDAALEALAGYAWPGNIRELRNVVSQAVVFTETGRIDVEHLGPVAAAVSAAAAMPKPVAPPSPAPAPSPMKPPTLLAPTSTDAVMPLEEQLRRMERERILEVLTACGNNQTRAAEQLGMPRRTFISRMAALGIPGRRSRPPGEKAPLSVEPDTLPSAGAHAKEPARDE